MFRSGVKLNKQKEPNEIVVNPAGAAQIPFSVAPSSIVELTSRFWILIA